MVDTKCAILRIEDIYSSSTLRRSHIARMFGWKHSRNPSSAWVAKISIVRSLIVRDFIRPVRDYSGANSQGTNGVMLGYILHPSAIYEVNMPTTTSKSTRYHCRIEMGKVVRMTETEAMSCLNAD